MSPLVGLFYREKLSELNYPELWDITGRFHPEHWEVWYLIGEKLPLLIMLLSVFIWC